MLKERTDLSIMPIVGGTLPSPIAGASRQRKRNRGSARQRRITKPD